MDTMGDYVRKDDLPDSQVRTAVQRLRERVKVALRVPRGQRGMISLIWEGILVADTERMTRLNLTMASDKWGYGQIFALVATLPSVAALINMFLHPGDPGTRYALS